MGSLLSYFISLCNFLCLTMCTEILDVYGNIRLIIIYQTDTDQRHHYFHILLQLSVELTVIVITNFHILPYKHNYI